MPTRRNFFLMTVFVYLIADIATAQQSIIYRNVSAENLPLSALANNSMDAEPADIDADGDPDIVIACEFCRNILLLNDGTGKFTNATATWLPNVTHDSEDIGIADFDNNFARRGFSSRSALVIIPNAAMPRGLYPLC